MENEKLKPTDKLQTLAEGVAWPYSFSNYLGRILWHLAWWTIWRIAWRRVHPLRPLILRCFRGSVGLQTTICASAWIEMPWHLTMGNWCSLGPRSNVYCLGPVHVGDYTVISQDVYICAGTHDYTLPTYPLQRPPIRIGNWVWIAAGAFIGPGVTIGDGAVIGARAVVTKDVPPWTIVAGNPARVVKHRRLEGYSPDVNNQHPMSEQKT